MAKLRHSIERSVPVGFNCHKEVSFDAGWKFNGIGKASARAQKFLDKAALQLGTLGGGNHFIEICFDKEGCVWVMLHSGSRNIGKELAEFHISTAKGLMGEVIKKYGDIKIDLDLAPLIVGSKEYNEYIEDLFWCQKFARASRDEMMRLVLMDLARHVFGYEVGEMSVTLERIDCHHNYVSNENTLFGQALVTRKGAVSARDGEYGIIPSSMGGKSFIVKGKGNNDSFCSCSHGAGRRMSRGQAKRTFTIDDLKAQTVGVECRKDQGVLDEIPQAYKNIDEVMDNQSDLVEIVSELTPLICVKG